MVQWRLGERRRLLASGKEACAIDDGHVCTDGAELCRNVLCGVLLGSSRLPIPRGLGSCCATDGRILGIGCKMKTLHYPSLMAVTCNILEGRDTGDTLVLVVIALARFDAGK